MNKTRSIFGLAISIALAFSFLSCSSDNDDNPPPPAVAISSSSGGSSSGGGGSSSSDGSSSSSGGNQGTLTIYSLNDAWVRKTGSSINTIITIIDSEGYFTKVEGDWLTVMNKGGIKIGDMYFRKITKTGTRTWSCQNLGFNVSTFAVVGWSDNTITMSADGRYFTTNSDTYTREQ